MDGETFGITKLHLDRNAEVRPSDVLPEGLALSFGDGQFKRCWVPRSIPALLSRNENVLLGRTPH